jgi:hypothetical protein
MNEESLTGILPKQWAAWRNETDGLYIQVKPIRLSKHALGYVTKRGFSVAEVEDAIGTCPWGAAELGRLDCRKAFAYGRDWNGKRYATKQVRPVFVEEAQETVVITVYTYYF